MSQEKFEIHSMLGYTNVSVPHSVIAKESGIELSVQSAFVDVEDKPVE